MNTAEKLNEKTIWSPSKNVVACDVEGEMVLLDLQSGTYFGLNGVGAEIWNQISQRKSMGEIQRHLLSVYQVAPDRCEAELHNLVIQLSDRGLLRSGGDDTAA
jgi:hypothetical protein